MVRLNLAPCALGEGLVVWEFVPALHVLQHVIYFEWLICIVTFLIVAVVDKTPIKVPEYVEEEA